MGTGGVFLRRLRAKVIDEPTDFGWIYSGKLAASGFPSSKDQVRWLAQRGVKSILTLTEFALPEEWLRDEKIKVKQIPMEDHTLPSTDVLDEAASYIEDEIKSGRAVLVHCLAGKGRTGLAVAAYLMKTEGLSARGAIDFVREKRPGSVEKEQERSVLEYESFLRREE